MKPLLQHTRSWLAGHVSRWALLEAIIGTVGLWLVDLGVVNWLSGTLATNSFWETSGNRLYHIGLYMTLAVLWFGTLRK